MSQRSDLGNIPNLRGAEYRAAVNGNLQAVVTRQYGATEPTQTYPLMEWWDSSNSNIKIRNIANNGWIVAGSFDSSGVSTLYSGGKPLQQSATIKDNLSSATDPSATDDTSFGYSVGSTWINTTTSRVFIAAKVSPTGSAVWRRVDVSSISDLSGYQPPEWTVLQSYLDTTGRTYVDLTTGNPENYARLRLRLRGVMTPSNADSIVIRLQSGGVFRSGSSDYWSEHLVHATTFAGVTNASGIPIAGLMRNDATGAVWNEVIIRHSAAATANVSVPAYAQRHNSGNLSMLGYGGGGAQFTGKITGIRMYLSSGSAFAGGEAYLDGSTL